VRRYFRHAENYFSIRLGAGISPELLNTQIAPNVTAKQFYSLRSQSINITYQQPLSKRWVVNGSFGLGQQEPLFAVGEYVTNINGSLSLKYQYK
jgi:YaiO family outer membrane protein